MLRTVVLERGMPGGELLNTEKLDDWIGEKSILGWELAQKFEEHSRLFGAEYVTANVTTRPPHGRAARSRPSPTRRGVHIPGGDHHGGRHADQARHSGRGGVRGQGRLVLRNLRRSVLPQSAHRRRRRWRRRRRGGGLPHALRGEGLRHASPRRASARRRSCRSACSRTRRSRSSGTRSPRRSSATSRG